MSGDYTRFTFDPHKHYTGVLKQQGRVGLDADWNEQVETNDRHWRAETLDIFNARCMVPLQTPNAFEIGVSGESFTIGRGRVYVDGILVENHGDLRAVHEEPLSFNHVLEETYRDVPIPYGHQPCYPNPPDLPEHGRFLVYLDVWEREVTYLEDQQLLDKALGGVDTATRLQTVWQVKTQTAPSNFTASCDLLEQLGGRFAPTGSRLSVMADAPPASEDPCIVSPSGGYKGLENRLYRAEVHSPSGERRTPATFKWSRDNASIVSGVDRVVELSDGRIELTVRRIGRDAVLRFEVDNHVELIDDHAELKHGAGVMGRVVELNEAERTVTVEAIDPFSPGDFDAEDRLRHTRLQRWDGFGEITDEWLDLGHGIQVLFQQLGYGGYRTAEYWVFAARTADGSVEELDRAPPRGIHHHYCPLAVLSAAPLIRESDCRTNWWPPVAVARRVEGCECTVCVTQASHDTGLLTVQGALEQAALRPHGGTVCIAPGFYDLGSQPLRIGGGLSVRIRGHGATTLLYYSGEDAAINITGASLVTIEDLQILAAATTVTDPTAAEGPVASCLSIVNSAWITVQRCFLSQTDPTDHPAVSIAGALAAITLRDNAVIADEGVGVGTVSFDGGDELGYAYTRGLYIERNGFWCATAGVRLGINSLYAAETRLSSNFVHGCSEAAIIVNGFVLPGSGVDIDHNELRATGDGVRTGADGVRILTNDISASGAGTGADGIVLGYGLNPDGIGRCQILQNRVTGLAGHGIAIRGPVESAMIKNNIIERVGAGGIVMVDDAPPANLLTIENNQLRGIAPDVPADRSSVAGIRLTAVAQASIIGNTIADVGNGGSANARRVGVSVQICRTVRVHGNDVSGIGMGPAVEGRGAGIEILLPAADRIDVANNTVQRAGESVGAGTSPWHALRIWQPETVIEALDSNTVMVSLASGELSFIGRANAFRRPVGQRIVNVSGNRLDAVGDVAAVNVRGASVVTFSDNQCSLSTTSDYPPATVELEADAVIANGNHVRGPSTAMHLHVPPLSDTGDGSFTAVSNIVNGQIRVNDADLPDTWKHLNVVTP